MVNVLEKPGFKRAWSHVEAGLSIKNSQDYKKAVALLDCLLDDIGENQHHPLFGFFEVLGTLIESYEADHVKIKGSSSRDVLQFLIDEHGLSQSDLPEIGSQGVVSEILHGRRALNARQIKALSNRFGVSPSAFF